MFKTNLKMPAISNNAPFLPNIYMYIELHSSHAQANYTFP